MTVAIVDSGGANLSSVQFALERLGAACSITRDAQRIERADRVILPGVGAAGAVMGSLREAGLVGCLRELRQPVLGICLGMQILFERSAEGYAPGLGLLAGDVGEIPARPGFPVPHMGWNRVRAGRPSRLLPADDDGAHFYFVHSFAAPPAEAPDSAVVASAEYGGRAIPAILERGNWNGVQFHPERSGAAGARLLARFLAAEFGAPAGKRNKQ